MRNYRKMLAAGLSIVLSLGVVGCGVSSQPETNEPVAQQQEQQGTVQSTSESRGASASDTITITVIDWNTGVAEEMQKAACKEYMDTHPGIIIDHQTVAYNDYNTKLNTLIAAGETPDIFYASDLYAINYGIDGVSQDLSALYKEAGIDMTEKFISPAMYGTDDAVFGLAYGVVSTIMYYDKAIFDAAGVEYPSSDPSDPDTWEEWTDKLKKLTVDHNGKHPGEDGFNPMAVKTYGTISPSWYYHLSALLNSNEGSFFSEDGLTLGDPAGLEVLNAVNDLSGSLQVAPTPIAKDALPAVASMFKEDQLACYIAGSYEYIDIAAENPDIGIAPLPRFEKPATISWAACCQMSATTEHPKEVFEFFRWYVEADTNPCHIASNMPNEYKYYEDESLFDLWMDPSIYNDDYRKVVPQMMANYAYLPEMCQVKNAGKIFDEYVAPALDTLWLGEKSAQEVCDDLGEEVNPVFEGVW